MGVVASVVRNVATMASTSARPTPCASARSLARWMTGPSAIGSENGTPSSITSAPPPTSACMSGTALAGVGSPAVTKGISAFRASRRSVSKVAAIRDIGRLELDAELLCDGVHVLVAAPGEVDEQDLLLGQPR